VQLRAASTRSPCVAVQVAWVSDPTVARRSKFHSSGPTRLLPVVLRPILPAFSGCPVRAAFACTKIPNRVRDPRAAIVGTLITVRPSCPGMLTTGPAARTRTTAVLTPISLSRPF